MFDSPYPRHNEEPTRTNMARIPTRETQTSTGKERHSVASGSASRSTSSEEKFSEKGKELETASQDQPIEPVRTISRVPGNPNYYEKNGLRTYGDGQDHETEPPMSWTRIMALIGMAFLWCGSQIPVYLVGGVLPIIYGDIGGVDIYVWAIIGNLLALAAVTPFTGALSDLFGRRTVACFGIFAIMIGMIICAAAPNMQAFVAGEVVAGIGGGISEMTALAGTGELAPTSKRGLYVGGVICTIFPFTPAIMWSQLITAAPGSSWRNNLVFCAVWAAVGLILVYFFYHPPPRPNSTGLSRAECLKRIDIVGGVLSVIGITLFLMGLLWGGYQYPWGSANVLAPLILGALSFGAFIVWEMYYAKYPMFPGRLKQEPRVMILILLITFVSGANFFAVLIWWPNQSQSMYDPDPIQVGLRGLPVGFGIVGGAVIASVALVVVKGNIRSLIFASCAVMTAGCGAMVIADPYNMNLVYAPITLACLGVGGVIIPVQIIVTVVCPDDLIATATALALTVRMLGGAIGFAIYFNLFQNKFIEVSFSTIVPAAVNAGIYNYDDIVQIALDIGHNYFYHSVYTFPEINSQEKYDAIVMAGREAFTKSFPQLWWAALAFGLISCIASVFLGDISKYLDDHIAVTLH